MAAASSPRVMMYKNETGVPYYYDRETGQTSWSPPTPADVQMGGMDRSASHEAPLLYAARESGASLEQPPQPPRDRKLSVVSQRKAKRKKVLTTLGKNLVANLGNIAVILTIAILANQIRQDLTKQQGEVADLRGQATAMKDVLGTTLNTTQEITEQATTLQAKIALFETLLSKSRENELQALLSDLRAANASLFGHLRSGIFNISNDLSAITTNLTASVSSIQDAFSVSSSSLQGLNNSAASAIQSVFVASLSTLQALNNSVLTSQASLLTQTQAAAVVSTDVSARVSTLEPAYANFSSRATILEQASTNASTLVQPLEQVSTNVSSGLTALEAALRTNYSGTVYYCGNTSLVNASMGGYKGAAQICRQQLPSCGPTAHMCTANEMVVISSRNTTQLPDIAWTASGLATEYLTSNIVDDCYGYTMDSSSRFAANWAYNTFGGVSQCSAYYPIACCAYRA